MEDTLNVSAFGKNDIRGIYPTEVNKELFFYTARGYAKWVKEQFEKSNINKKYDELCFTVAMDDRLHSLEIGRAHV